jgi:hypothetical protein
MKGILLLDGDDRKLPDHEIRADGLEIIRWTRYEAENYLLVPSVLIRFVNGGKRDLFSESITQDILTHIGATPFLNIVKDPFEDDEVQISIGASKKFLPGLFEKLDIPLSKSEYYAIAQVMKPQEIHPEIVEKLNFIHERIKK